MATIPGTAGPDTLTGTNNNDSITGDAGNDSLLGLGGEDTIRGGDDNDTIFGGNNDDSLFGDAGADSISGDNGKDTIFGGTGSDTIFGGADNDSIDGGSENDSLFGGDGNDTILGGLGNDSIESGSGRATLFGGDGNDTINASAGDDASIDGGTGADLITGSSSKANSITGGAGQDTITGGTDKDTLFGGADNDSITAGANDDSVQGDAGNDTLFGGAGKDTLLGGTGADVIQGGAGDDRLFGGDDADLFNFADGFGSDIVQGGEAGADLDTLNFSALTTSITATFNGSEAGTATSGAGSVANFTQIEVITATNQADTVNAAASNASQTIDGLAGNDSLTGGSANDNIFGGAGLDTLSGGGGGDLIQGGDGSDNIDGGAGNDILSGGGDADTIAGGTGADTIDGGAGDDVASGGAGSDIIDGGAGNDTLSGGADNDSISGGVGADNIQGGGGDDTIDGGDGADFIVGDAPFFVSLTDTMGYSYAQDIDGNQAAHFGEEGTGGENDPLLLIDNDINTEQRIHEEDIIEYFFGQTVLAGTSITLVEGAGAEDEPIQIYVTNGTTDPDGDVASANGNGVGFTNTIANGTLIYEGPSDATITLTIPIDATHIQFIGQGNHGGWAEMEFTELVGAGSGPPGNDSITGGAGNDTLDGAGGLDTLDGGADADTFAISDGDDTIIGGDGEDTFDASLTSSLFNTTIDVDVNNGGAGSIDKSGDDADGTPVSGTDTVTGVETFIADEFADEADVITLTTEALPDDVVLDNTAVGIFTSDNPAVAPIAFGGVGEPTINDILSGTFVLGGERVKPDGSFAITSGEETGSVGAINFENFETINFATICFTDGVMIRTPDGEAAVETLRIGDLVETLDHGAQKIRWIGSSHFSAAQLRANPKLNPIRIGANALGEGLPDRELAVSPQHRILIQSKIAVRMFDAAELLVPVKHLLELDNIEAFTPDEGVNYHHILLEKHEIVWANGAFAETLLPGPEAMKTLSQEAREEIEAIFPNLSANIADAHARLVPKGQLARKLASRHAKNKKPLQFAMRPEFVGRRESFH